MTLLNVTVTEDHIARGERGQCSSCPLALAVLDATGLTPSVSLRRVLIPGMSGDWIFLPDKAIRFRERFDDGKKVTPFSFTLEVP